MTACFFVIDVVNNAVLVDQNIEKFVCNLDWATISKINFHLNFLFKYLNYRLLTRNGLTAGLVILVLQKG
jgi:hypothetical protein